MDYTRRMSLQLIYFWSKKIHRLAMWVMTVLGTGMAVGGLVLHRELEGEWIPALIDTSLIRYWHNKIASPFALFLAVMIGTGLIMWAVPKILANRVVKSVKS